MSNNLHEQFLNNWRALAAKLGLDQFQSTSIGGYLLGQYSGGDRYYHNVGHILFMLAGFEALGHKFERPLAAELAIFFHDAIYAASRSDNEEQSASRMKELLVGKVEGQILDAAAFSVEATKKHAATASNDTNLILDLDMAVLGQPWAVYAFYAQGVMLEYLPVYGEEAYRRGRVELFLAPMITRSAIFLTDDFKQLDEPARKNMQLEKEILHSGKSFGSRGV